MSGVLKLGNITLGTENNGKIDITNVGDITATGGITANSINADSSFIKSTFDAPDTEALNSSSSNEKDVDLPIFAVRAWANFNGLNADTTSINGEACCLIYGSGNINRIVRTAAGHYRVYFETPMPDANYAVSGATNPAGTSGSYFGFIEYASEIFTTTDFYIELRDSTNGSRDVNRITFMVVR